MIKKKTAILVSILLVIIVAGSIYAYQTVQAEKNNEHFTQLVSYINKGENKKAEQLMKDHETKGYINKATKEGYTPLELALQRQQYSLAGSLISQGAQVNPKANQPLFVQLVLSLDSYVQMQGEAKQKEVNRLFETALKEAKDELKKTDIDGNNALHTLAINGNPVVAQLLLDNGLNPAGINKNGETPLMIATALGNEEMCETLLKQDKKLANVKDQDDNTLLVRAVMGGRPAVLKRLLKEDMDVNHQNNMGKTALMYASEFGEVKQVKLLLDAKADTSLKSKEGMTAYHYAKEWNHREVMNLLK